MSGTINWGDKSFRPEKMKLLSNRKAVSFTGINCRWLIWKRGWWKIRKKKTCPRVKESNSISPSHTEKWKIKIKISVRPFFLVPLHLPPYPMPPGKNHKAYKKPLTWLETIVGKLLFIEKSSVKWKRKAGLSFESFFFFFFSPLKMRIYVVKSDRIYGFLRNLAFWYEL